VNGGVGVNSDISGATVMYGSGGAGSNGGTGTASSGGGTNGNPPTVNRGGPQTVLVLRPQVPQELSSLDLLHHSLSHLMQMVGPELQVRQLLHKVQLAVQ
jgi:hypothetical protein